MRRVLLTITSVGMAVSTVAVPFDDFSSGPGQAVTPPGAFFAIWGLVIVLCLGVAVLSWWRDRTPMFAAAGWPLVVAQAGFTVWLLVAWASSAIGTIVVFAVILIALLLAMARLRRVDPAPWLGLIAVTVGVYAGWSSAAIWLNIVTTAPATIGDSPVAQAGALIGAGCTAAAVLWWLRPSVGYAAAVAWALIGVSISEASASAALPLAVAMIDLAVVVVLTVRLIRSRSASRSGASSRIDA